MCNAQSMNLFFFFRDNRFKRLYHTIKTITAPMAFIPLLPLYNNVFHKELFLLLLYHLAAKHAVNTYIPANTADKIRVF